MRRDAAARRRSGGDRWHSIPAQKKIMAPLGPTGDQASTVHYSLVSGPFHLEEDLTSLGPLQSWRANAAMSRPAAPTTQVQTADRSADNCRLQRAENEIGGEDHQEGVEGESHFKALTECRR